MPIPAQHAYFGEIFPAPGEPPALTGSRGEEKTAIYNEHYIPLAVRNHPRFMGSSFKATWPEAWEPFDTLFKYVDRTGIATPFGDSKSAASPGDQYIELALERHGYVEELVSTVQLRIPGLIVFRTYFEGDVIPIRGEDMEIAGYYVPVSILIRFLSIRARACLRPGSGDHQTSHFRPQIANNQLDDSHGRPTSQVCMVAYSVRNEGK